MAVNKKKIPATIFLLIMFILFVRGNSWVFALVTFSLAIGLLLNLEIIRKFTIAYLLLVSISLIGLIFPMEGANDFFFGHWNDLYKYGFLILSESLIFSIIYTLKERFVSLNKDV